MKVVAIVQARMTSTRLPGKVLREVLGRPLLGYQLERLRRCRSVDEVVVATTANRTDDPVVAFAEAEGHRVWRGSEEDVLSRMYEAACLASADVVVRLTADCPLIDPGVVDRVVGKLIDGWPEVDYVSNAVPRSFPAGLDVEAMRMEALAAAHAEALARQEREHVTPFIYNHPERFQCLSVEHRPSLAEHRWTVDHPEDFELVRRIIEALYPTKPDFDYRDVLGLLERHPDWRHLNAHVYKRPAPIKDEAGAYPEQA